MNNQITIIEARKILEEDAEGLSDAEVKEIIDWLDKMADIAIESVEKKSNQLELSSVKTKIPAFINTK